MELDLHHVVDIGMPTVIGLVGAVLLVAAGLLLLSWLQQPDLAPLKLWSLAFGLGAVGTVLFAARGQIADFWSIVIANAFLTAAYGCLWSGARQLDGRPVLPGCALAGVVVWLLAMLVPEIYGDLIARTLLRTIADAGYTGLTAYELWRARGDGLPSRWPAIILLVVHTLSLLTRIQLMAEWSESPNPSHMGLFVFSILESTLVAIAGAYLLASLVKEKLAATYQRSASTDPLTGIANRRAFLNLGERLLQRSAVDGRRCCLLLCDIDHFKSINDAYGHAAGDSVLRTFCNVTEAQIRPTDLFGRIGGEEFACLLLDAGVIDAARVAERVRRAFEDAVHTCEGESFGATVSIGVAAPAPDTADLHALLLSADRALYRAKRAGRNRIEQVEPPGVREVELIATGS